MKKSSRSRTPRKGLDIEFSIDEEAEEEEQVAGPLMKVSDSILIECYFE
jgi:hypothetical protein